MRALFSGLDFELRRGERLYLTGSNGSGKTSLLRILCGLLTPDGGEVLWNGAPIRSLAEDYSRELVYLGHATGVKDELTPLENLPDSGAAFPEQPRPTERSVQRYAGSVSRATSICL